MSRSLRADRAFALFIAFICIVLYLLPTGFPEPEDGYVRCGAWVVAVDNINIHRHGIVQTGVQGVSLVIVDGPFRGQRIETANPLLGKPATDKLFAVSDKALVVVKEANGQVVTASLLDHYRLGSEAVLFSLFVLLLLWYAGWSGLKAILSFAFAVLVLWKVLWPLFLRGWDPVTVALLVVCAIAGCVVFLATGLSRTGLAAFLGTVGGASAASVLALIFGDLFRVYGAAVPYAETLLHIGYSHIDLTKVFLVGIFLAASGAMMAVAVDVAVAVSELVAQNPGLSRREAVASGFMKGRTLVGTMTTTLLLAYSGSFTALMMVLIAQGAPVVNILNLSYIAAEILHTLVGSFGIVLVAPLTALLAGWLLTDGN